MEVNQPFNEYSRFSQGWKMLTYFHGDKYQHHCTLNSERKANLMFTCDETLSKTFSPHSHQQWINDSIYKKIIDKSIDFLRGWEKKMVSIFRLQRCAEVEVS